MLGAMLGVSDGLVDVCNEGVMVVGVALGVTDGTLIGKGFPLISIVVKGLPAHA
jgi:hypothetical protein